MARTPKAKAESKPVVDSRGMMLMPLGGADYVLRPSWEAIDAIEKVLGRGLIVLASEAVRGALTIADQAIIIAEMMKAEGKRNPEAGPSYKQARPERLAELIYEAAAPSITARLAVVLTAAMTGGYTASGEPKPAT